MAILRTRTNPNDIHGERACLACGQHKGYDCGGDWLVFEHVKVFNPNAPHAVVCENHLTAFLAKNMEALKLGYAGLPEEKPQAEAVVETPKRKPRRKKTPEDEELSL